MFLTLWLLLVYSSYGSPNGSDEQQISLMIGNINVYNQHAVHVNGIGPWTSRLEMGLPEGSSCTGTQLSIKLLENNRLMLRHYGEAFVGLFREGRALYPPMDVLTALEAQLPAGMDNDGMVVSVQENDVLFLVLPHIEKWPMKPIDLIGAMLAVDVSSSEAFGHWAGDTIFLLKDSRATVLMATIGRKDVFAKRLDNGNVGFRVMHSQDYGHFYLTFATFRLADGAAVRPRFPKRLQDPDRALDVSPFTLVPLSQSDSGSESDDESSESSDESKEELSGDEEEKEHAEIKERFAPLPPGTRRLPVSPLDDIMSRAYRKSLKSSSSYVSADARVEEIPVSIPIDKFPGNRTPPSPLVPKHQLLMPMITYIPRNPVAPFELREGEGEGEGGEQPEQQFPLSAAAGRSLFNRPIPVVGKPAKEVEQEDAIKTESPEKMDIAIEAEQETIKGDKEKKGEKRSGPNEAFQSRLRFARDRLRSEQPNRTRKAFPY